MRRSYSDSFNRAEKMRAISNEYTSEQIAKMFDVSSGYVRAVLTGKKCNRSSNPKGVFKNIKVGHVKFAIYNDGRVWSYSVSKFLKFNYANGGYARFSVKLPNRTVRLKVHRLVLTLFKRKPRPGEIARHLDDDRQNNHISNLAWGDHEDNCNDALRNECYAKGADVGSAKLTEKQVKKFAEAYKRGYSGSMKGYCIAMKEKMKLNVSIKQLLSILKGTYWSHITGITSYEKKFSVKLDEKSVRFIHKRYAKLKNKYTQADICRRLERFLATKGYEVSWRTIKKALNGHSFKSIYNEFNK